MRQSIVGQDVVREATASANMLFTEMQLVGGGRRVSHKLAHDRIQSLPADHGERGAMAEALDSGGYASDPSRSTCPLGLAVGPMRASERQTSLVAIRGLPPGRRDGSLNSNL